MITGTLEVCRIWRQTSVPGMPGSIRSSSTMSAPARSNSASASGPVGGDRHLEALLAQHVGEGVAVALLVLDDQYAGHAVSFLRSWVRAVGSGRPGRCRRAAGLAGQGQGERRPLALDRPDPHLAAVGGGDVLDDREAEAGAAGGAVPRRVDAVEPLEDAVELVRRDADALVGDADVDGGVVAGRGDHDRGALGRVGDGVGDQVAHRHGDLLAVAEQHEPLGAVVHQLDLARRRRRSGSRRSRGR